MKKLWFNILFTSMAVGLSACNGGTTSASGSQVATQSCKFSSSNLLKINADTYQPGDKFSTVFEQCEFERAFEDQFAASYADSPAANGFKTHNMYQFYSYANLQAAFEELFPTRNSTNRPFNSGDYFKDMRELSAFFANIVQETNSAAAPAFDSNGKLVTAGALGVAYGLNKASEGDCANNGLCLGYGTKKSYCDAATSGGAAGKYSTTCNEYTAGTQYCRLAKQFCEGLNTSTLADYDETNINNQYFGRGGKQLSYPAAYIMYGSYMYPNDKLKLAKNPNLVHTDGKIAWGTALSFWSYPTMATSTVSNEKPSMHEGFFNKSTYFDASSANKDFDDLVGFGKTINLINGGVECGKQMVYAPYQVINRVNAYIELLFLTNAHIPVDKLVVTRDVDGKEVQDIYTREDLVNNISRQGADGTKFRFGADSPDVDATSDTAPHLVKKYHRLENGVMVEKTYNVKELTNSLPNYIYNWGSNGRYNTQPLISDYYYPSKTITITTASGSRVVKTSDIKNITLYYDKDSSYNAEQLVSERLDCSGVTNADGS